MPHSTHGNSKLLACRLNKFAVSNGHGLSKCSGHNTRYTGKFPCPESYRMHLYLGIRCILRCQRFQGSFLPLPCHLHIFSTLFSPHRFLLPFQASNRPHSNFLQTLGDCQPKNSTAIKLTLQANFFILVSPFHIGCYCLSCLTYFLSCFNISLNPSPLHAIFPEKIVLNNII